MNYKKLGIDLFLASFILTFLYSVGAHLHTLQYDDRTGLNSATIHSVYIPYSIGEIQEIIKKGKGPFSVAGAKYSQGGQIIATYGTVIDMSHINMITAFDSEQKIITVGAGITWRAIQKVIDKYDLSISIMQSYNNFSVGGSLSVNVHGRYIGKGPIIESVKQIKIVLADGSLVTASRTENNDLFCAAIGGYGAVGVIVEVTLQLDDNQKLERRSVSLSLDDYEEYFFNNIKNNKDVVMHNSNLHPDAYDKVTSLTWYKTDKSLTIKERLKPGEILYLIEKAVQGAIKRGPGVKWLRANIFESLRTKNNEVMWKNYEAGYRVEELAYPRTFSVSLLQEYFVPVQNMMMFVNKMKKILLENSINVLNLSIRHVEGNDESLLSWCPQESFAFVLYYDQWHTKNALVEGKVWTQKLIDAVLECGGTYYLPYKIYATPEQFKKAYPRFDEFLDVKKKYDPTKKFGNALWEAYN